MRRGVENDKVGFGMTLILIGIVWLLFKFNILSFSLFGAISDLWPLLLVVAGVNMIFYNHRTVSFVMWILFLGVLIWYGQFGGGGRSDFVAHITGDQTEVHDTNWEVYQETAGEIDLKEAEEGSLSIDLGFGNVYVDASDSSSVTYTVPDDYTDIYSRLGGKSASIEFDQESKNFFDWVDKENSDYKFHLPENVEWDIDINTGAIDANIDLEDLDVRNLDIDCGAGDIDITFGKKAALVYTEIDCGATEITLNVPHEAGIEVNFDGLVDEENFSAFGLERITDSIYRSPGFEKEDIKIFVEIDTGIGDVTLNAY